MPFVKGQSGNPAGKRPGTIDRVNAVLEAIQAKAGEKGQAGVVKWLKGLDDDIIAGLYGKLLPKDVNLSADMKVNLLSELTRIAGKAPTSASTEAEIVEPGPS